jgi:hypothetical protein
MAYKTTSYVQGLTEASTTQKQALGTIRDEGDKGYKYVKYSDAAIAAVAGTVVAYAATTGYATNTVTPDVSADNGVGAGVMMSAAAAGTDSYHWIQIWGLSGILEVDVVSGALGNPMTMSTTTDSTVKVAGAVTDAVVGIAYNVTASACRLILCAPR